MKVFLSFLVPIAIIALAALAGVITQDPSPYDQPAPHPTAQHAPVEGL